MTILTVTSKGQVTLRRDVLAHMGINPGDRIVIDKLPDGKIQARAAQPAGSISDIFGMLGRSDAPALSIDEMNEIVAESWASKA